MMNITIAFHFWIILFSLISFVPAVAAGEDFSDSLFDCSTVLTDATGRLHLEAPDSPISLEWMGDRVRCEGDLNTALRLRPTNK
jgi:hypothetical protein